MVSSAHPFFRVVKVGSGKLAIVCAFVSTELTEFICITIDNIVCFHKALHLTLESWILYLGKLIECSHSILEFLVCRIVVLFEEFVLCNIVSGDGSIIAFILCKHDSIDLIGDASDFGREFTIFSLTVAIAESLSHIGIEGVDGILESAELSQIFLGLGRLVIL